MPNFTAVQDSCHAEQCDDPCHQPADCVMHVRISDVLERKEEAEGGWSTRVGCLQLAAAAGMLGEGCITAAPCSDPQSFH